MATVNQTRLEYSRLRIQSVMPLGPVEQGEVAFMGKSETRGLGVIKCRQSRMQAAPRECNLKVPASYKSLTIYPNLNYHFI